MAFNLLSEFPRDPNCVRRCVLLFALNWVLLGFTGYYWVLLGFTGLKWVTMAFNLAFGSFQETPKAYFVALNWFYWVKME